jgi:hypothetical protein
LSNASKKEKISKMYHKIYKLKIVFELKVEMSLNVMTIMKDFIEKILYLLNFLESWLLLSLDKIFALLLTYHYQSGVLWNVFYNFSRMIILFMFLKLFIFSQWIACILKMKYLYKQDY